MPSEPDDMRPVDEPDDQPTGGEEEELDPEDLTDAELGYDPAAPPTRGASARDLDALLAQLAREEPEDPESELCVVRPGELGGVLRAARWHARISQRELAADAGVPRSALARIESEPASDPRLSTLSRLVEACGLLLVLMDGEYDLLHTDARRRHRDRGDRHLPAHLVNAPVTRFGRGWWGWERVAWRMSDPTVPERSYRHRH